MSRSELLRRIEAIVNLDEGTLTGAELLEDLPDWDSLAVLSVIALYDKEFGRVLKPTEVFQCKTMDQVLDLVGDGLDADPA